MAALTIQAVPAAGLALATTAASGGDTVAPSGPNDDRCFLYVNNGGGSSITVSLADPGTTPAGNAGTVTPVSVAAGAFKLIALPPGAINPATGTIAITYSATATVTVAALRR